MSTYSHCGQQVASSSLMGEREQVREDAVLGQRVQAGKIANTKTIEQQRPRVPSALAGTNRGK